MRLCSLPEDAPAILYGCPSLPDGTRTLALETSWDLPSLGPGATAKVDMTVPGARRDHFADALVATSSIAFVQDSHVRSSDKVRMTARNVSASTVDLAAAPAAGAGGYEETQQTDLLPALSGSPATIGQAAPERRNARASQQASPCGHHGSFPSVLDRISRNAFST